MITKSIIDGIASIISVAKLVNA